MSNYLGGEELQFSLCNVTRSRNSNGRDQAAPAPNYADVLFTFPPNGPVNVIREINVKETENKSSGATSTEFKPYDKPVDIVFQIDVTPDDESGLPAETMMLAIDALFQLRDDYGARPLYGPRYPLLGADIEMVYWAKLEWHDNNGTDEITGTLTFRQWFYSAPKRATGGGAGDSATGSGGANGGDIDDAMQEYIDEFGIDLDNGQSIIPEDGVVCDAVLGQCFNLANEVDEEVGREDTETLSLATARPMLF